MRIFGHVITLYRNRKSLVFAGISRYLQSFLLCRRPVKNQVRKADIYKDFASVRVANTLPTSTKRRPLLRRNAAPVGMKRNTENKKKPKLYQPKP